MNRYGEDSFLTHYVEENMDKSIKIAHAIGFLKSEGYLVRKRFDKRSWMRKYMRIYRQRKKNGMAGVSAVQR